MAEITLKLSGVLWITSALSSLASAFAVATWRSEFFSPVTFVTLIVVAIAGLALIALSARISRLLFPVASEIQISIRAKDFVAVGLLLLGVYFFVSGIRHGSAVLYQFVTKPKWDQVPVPEYLWERSREAIVSSVVELIAGIVLAAGNSRLALFWSPVDTAAPVQKDS